MADASLFKARPPTRDMELDTADRWLDAWGLWARGKAANLGLPTRSVLGRVIEEGPNRARQPGPSCVPPNVKAELVEAAVVHAPARIKAIAIEHYCISRFHPVEVQAQRLNTSRAALYRDLDVVRAYFAGVLFGETETAAA